MAWDVIYYKTADDSVPAAEFLAGAPPKVAANLLAVLDAVADAPPPQFSGGGKWEAMHAPIMRKPWRTVFGKRDYAAVRRLGDQHLACYPRRIAE